MPYSVAHAMDNIEKLRMIKKLKDVSFSSKTLENERDQKIAQISSTKKGEFETTAMYNKRMHYFEKEIQELLLSSQEKVTNFLSIVKYEAYNDNHHITQNKNRGKLSISFHNGSIWLKYYIQYLEKGYLL